jgi:hypothetical protein
MNIVQDVMISTSNKIMEQQIVIAIINSPELLG